VNTKPSARFLNRNENEAKIKNALFLFVRIFYVQITLFSMTNFLANGFVMSVSQNFTARMSDDDTWENREIQMSNLIVFKQTFW
jgi:hypothetical protein